MDRSDVLIIGGGIAGITTALELLDGGKSVMLLDRDEEGVFGGLARESFGGMFFVDSPEQRRQGIRDSVDLAYARLVQLCGVRRRTIAGPRPGPRPMCRAAPTDVYNSCVVTA